MSRPDVVTYSSVNAKIDEAWIGYIVLGDGSYWGVRFSGASEEIVVSHALRVWEQERAKYGLKPVIEADKPVEPSGWSSAPVKVDGRGHHLAGKVWMINRATADKVRIEPSQVADYESRGYVRGGPRSK